jgi:hypothetical protein
MPESPTRNPYLKLARAAMETIAPNNAANHRTNLRNDSNEL